MMRAMFLLILFPLGAEERRLDVRSQRRVAWTQDSLPRSTAQGLRRRSAEGRRSEVSFRRR